MQNYAASVPAVQKALAALSHLYQGSARSTLTEMSRALGVNRSTLLAVLNTLRSAGFVARDSDDGYGLGPALISYGDAAARATGPVDVFQEPAAWLADVIGESVALFALSDDDVVCAAALRGKHEVASLVTAGDHRPAMGSAAGAALLAGLPAAELTRTVGDAANTLEPELAQVRQLGYALRANDGETGQVSIAAPICNAQGRLVAALVVMGPAYRLTNERVPGMGQLVRDAAERASVALGSPGYEPYVFPALVDESWRGTRPTGLHGQQLDAFLAQPWVASLACLKDSGYPYTVPVWYEWRDGAFWLVPHAGAAWAGYVRAHPRISMTISEPQPPFRRVLVEGRAVQMTDSASDFSADAIQRRMARRYLGRQAASYLASPPRRRDTFIRIEPDKITSWEGLVAHPRYQGEPAA